jgi:autoinducer 2-binding periplasmic protein LuxP
MRGSIRSCARGGALLTGAAALALAAGAEAGRVDLSTLPADQEYWTFQEVQSAEVLESFQELVGAPGVPLAVELDRPVQIAVIYPSHDVSDFWLRNFLAMVARLEELQVPFETVQFASGMDDHALQATYTEQVLQDDFDYVIFGPTELSLQEENIKMLVDAPDHEVFVWNYDLVPTFWGAEQPYAYVGFSHLAGALEMCDWVVEHVGTEGIYAMNRGTPGAVDDQRSGGFRDCLAEKSDWEMAYEHYGNYMREGGFDGTQSIIAGYPEVTLIHNANTAMAMGAVSALQASGLGGDILTTGWGGTGDELEALRLGELGATPMRMADDVGVATAELIKLDLEGRRDETPLIFLGRITIVHSGMDADEIDAMEEEAFRYTGIGTLER